jgi:hypothetical protein
MLSRSGGVVVPATVQSRFQAVDIRQQEFNYHLNFIHKNI